MDEQLQSTISNEIIKDNETPVRVIEKDLPDPRPPVIIKYLASDVPNGVYFLFMFIFLSKSIT